MSVRDRLVAPRLRYRLLFLPHNLSDSFSQFRSAYRLGELYCHIQLPAMPGFVRPMARCQNDYGHRPKPWVPPYFCDEAETIRLWHLCIHKREPKWAL
jgi:hypothetical protein